MIWCLLVVSSTRRIRLSILSARVGGEVFVVEVGISDIGLGESAGDERFHEGGVNTDCYVPADSLFGPVSYRSQS